MQFLHTMIRAKDLDATLTFFCTHLGLVEVNRYDSEKGRFTLVFLAAPADVESAKERKAPLVEITYNWDTEDYDLGDAYGHIAVQVPDATAACEMVRTKGGKVTREAGPMKHGGSVIAFVEDPDGYKIEFVERQAA